jgi:hypothetical protein
VVFQIANTFLLQPRPVPASKEEQKQLLLLVSFCARATRLAVIISVSLGHMKMRDSGEEHVHPLTLCPNGDSAVIATFAHKLGSSNVTPLMSH